MVIKDHLINRDSRVFKKVREEGANSNLDFAMVHCA